jgi:RNA polymerase sigma-70 factor (ECF subfamily)
VPVLSFLDKTDKDAQLMLAYFRGDASAFETLYRKHKDALYRFFLRQCGNQAVAEELYQEVWLRVIRARTSYTHNAKFITWLYHIAHNILIDFFRKPVEQDDTELDEEQIPANASNDPALILNAQEKIQRFRVQLQSLPREQMETFLLKEEAGLSLEEIASTTGENVETVKSRLRYAVKKLRQSLNSDEDRAQ